MMGPFSIFRSYGARSNEGIDGAIAWLMGQLDPVRRATGGADVYADADYAPADTLLRGGFRVPAGTPLAQEAAVAVDTPQPIPGHFSGTLRGHATVPVQDRGLVSPVVLDAPLPVPPGFVGTFRGRLVGAPSGGTYRVDAYVLGSSGYAFQGSAAVDGAGGWTLAANGQAGEWRFRAVNAITGVQVGGEWQAALNGAARTQYRVEAFLVNGGTTTAQGNAPVFLQNAVPVWSFTATGLGGEWRFRLVDVDTGVQEGREWSPGDAARYDDLELRLLGSGGAGAPLATAPATGDGRWEFTTDDPSPKLVALVRVSTGEELARWGMRTWLIRSFGYAADDPEAGSVAEERSYVQDQALAILAMLATGNNAVACRMATALMDRQEEDGAFPVYYLQLQTAGWDEYHRAGPIAWAAYALMKAADGGAGVAGCDPAALRAAADNALAWLDEHVDETVGLVHEGNGRYPGGLIDPSNFESAYLAPGFDTAANAVAWMAFRASRDAYRKAAGNRLRDAMLAVLWDEALSRFARFAEDGGVRSGSSSLDAHVLGSMALRAWRRGDRALDALAHAEASYPVTEEGTAGFRAYSAAEGMPGADSRLWVEGSFAASLALQRGGDDTRDLDAGLMALQEEDGSFRGGALRDSALEVVDDAKSVAATAWFVLSRFPNLFLWTELDPPPVVPETREAYRMTVFAPAVDGDETTVLRPRAGSPHNDAFQVTTEEDPPAGWKPYLSLRSNRRGELDARTFHAEGGEIIVEVLDARLDAQDNVTRWASAFIGDERGRTWMQGLRAFIEVSLDGGSTWAPWFGGRIAVPASPSAGENGPVVRFQVRDHRVEEYREVFTQCPHPSQWGFCRPSPLLPIGYGAAMSEGTVPPIFELDTPPWSKIVTRRQGILTASSQNPGGMVIYLPNTKGPERLRPPAVLFEIAARRAKTPDVAPYGEVCPDIMVELRKVTKVGGNKVFGAPRYYLLAPVHFIDTLFTDTPARDGYDGERVSPIFICNTPDREYKVVCGVGIRPFPPTHALHSALPTETGITNEWAVVLWNFGPPRKGAPLLLSPVDGVTLYQKMLEGALSDLDEKMEPAYPAIRYDQASFDAARARVIDETAGSGQPGGARMRFMIEQSADLQTFFEKEIAPVIRHASVVAPGGEVRLVDLEIPSDPTILPEVTAEDYIAGDWEQGQDVINAVTGGLDLFGWSEIEMSENRRGKDTPYEVPALGVQRQSMGSLAMSEFAVRLPIAQHTVKLQGLKPVTADSDGVQKALAPVLQYYLSFFGTGAAYLDMRGRRHTLDAPGRFPGGLMQGTWALVETPESPNPAVNRRGGHRVMLLVQREEDGPELRLRWLDAGPDATPVGIGLEDARLSDEHPRSEVLVDVVGVEDGRADAQLQYAMTAVGQPRPADDTPRWTTAGYFTAGTAHLTRVIGGPRVWIRGRRVARAPQHLASDWTYAGPVDLEPIPAPTLFTATVVNGGDVRLSWVASVPNVDTELYLARGGVPAEWTPVLREATAHEGVGEHFLYNLEPGADYAAAARFVDTTGAAGPFVVTLFTTPSDLEDAPRPAGIAVIIGGAS